MKFLNLRCLLAGLLLVAVSLLLVGDAAAQCATCPSPTVAYQPVTAYSPVAVQPTVAYRPYTGWYPGKWLDQWRLRRAGVTAPASTTAYTPTYTAAYAPTYTAAYRPYVTSYAPLSAPAQPACNTCTQTAYYRVTQTVARPVLMRPVVVAPVCNTCSFTPACGCDACSSGVSQATYTEPACSSCAAASATAPADSTSYGASNVGPQTPQPSLAPVPDAANSQLRQKPAVSGSGTRESAPPAGSDLNEIDPLEKFDPGPAASETDSSTYYPQLLDPRDRTARSSRQPTVNVWNAVYRKTGAIHQASRQTSRKPVVRSQAEIDADGWSAVAPRGR